MNIVYRNFCYNFILFYLYFIFKKDKFLEVWICKLENNKVNKIMFIEYVKRNEK